MVLISLTTTWRSRVTKTSTRARPSQPMASKVRHGQVAHLVGDLAVDVGGHVEVDLLLGEVLGLEVVEARRAVHPDLGDLAGGGRPPSRSASTPHSSSRAPTKPSSTMTFGS